MAIVNIIFAIYVMFGRLHKMAEIFLYNSPDVANLIKKYAKHQKIPLKSLLEDCGLGSNTFSHMLHGRSIAFDSLAKIADYLDCSVDYLLGRAAAPASFYGDGFTAHDKALVDAYKKQPDIRPAVDKLLGLNGKPAYDFSGMDLSGAAIAAFGGTTSADDSTDYSAISELLSNKDKEL